MSVVEVEQLCVTAFTLSQTRQDIFSGLQALISELTTAAVQGELWLDGSFLTIKIDPEDVDLVLRVQGDFYDTCTPEQRDKLDWVVSNLKASHHCDSYLWVEYPPNHPLYWEGEWMKAYWIKQFGWSRGQDFKGIVALAL